MQGLSKTLSVVVDSEGVGDLVGDMGRAQASVVSLRTAIGGLGAGLAALSAGGLAKSISAASDFESKMAEVQKVTSEAFAEDFQSEILDMSKNIPLAASELATLTEQAGRFGVAEENIRSFVETTAKMAEATDVSVEQAGEAFAKLATLTSTPIPKMENLGSAINTLSNNFATSSQEIVDSMLRSAGTLSQLGMSQTDIAGLSAALNAVSESSERAGTRMRRLAQEMLDPAKVGALGQALGVTGEEFKAMARNDPTGTILKMAKAMKEGGESADILQRNLSTTSRQALAGLGSNLDQVNRALAMSSKAFKEGTSLQEEFQIAVQTTKNQFQLLKNELTAVAIQTGQVLLPAVKGAISVLRTLVGAFSKVNKATGGVAGAITLLSGLVTGLAAAFYGLAPILAPAAGGLSTVATAAAAVLAPFALLTGAALGVAAAFKSDFAGIATTANKVLTAVKTEVAATAQLLTSTFGPALQTAGNAFEGFGTRVEAALAPIVDLVGNKLVAAITTAGAKIRAPLLKLSALWQAHGETVRRVIDQRILGALEGFGDAIESAYAGEWGRARAAASITLLGIKADVRTVLSKVPDVAAQAVSSIKEKLPRPVKQAMAEVKQVIDFGLQAIEALLNGRVDLAKISFSLMFLKAKAAVTTRLNELKTVVGAKVAELKPVVTKKLRQVVTAATNALSALKARLPPQVQQAIDRAKKPINDLAVAFQQLKPKILNAINPILGPIDKLARKLGYLNKQGEPTARAMTTAALAISGLTNPITAAVGAVLTFSKIWNKNLYGIRDTTQQALTRVRQLWNTHIPPLLADTKRIFGQILQYIQTTLNRIWNIVIKPVLNSIRQLWAVHGDAILRETRENYEALRSYIKTIVDALAPIVKAALGALIVIFREGAKILRGIWNEWGDEITAVAKFTFDLVGSILNTALDALITSYRVFSNVFQGDWEAAWNAAAGFFERVFNGILTFVEKWGSGFLKWLHGLWKDASSWIKTTAKNLMTSAVTAVTDAIEGVFEAFARWLFGNSLIKDLFNGIARWLRNTAKNAITGAVGQIISGMESVFNSIDTSGIENAINDVLGLVNNVIRRLGKIPKTKTVTIRERRVVESKAAKAGGGSSGGGGKKQGFAEMHSGGIVNAGSGLPAMLHGREAVVPLDRLKPLVSDALLSAAGSMGGGGGGGGLMVVVRNNEFNGVANGEDAADIIADGVTTRLRRR